MCWRVESANVVAGKQVWDRESATGAAVCAGGLNEHLRQWGSKCGIVRARTGAAVCAIRWNEQMGQRAST